MLAALLFAVLLLAAVNGANDNFKGVATIYGSGTTSYRVALAWATITTLAGALCAALFATSLVKTFSGQGLVPGSVSQTTHFVAAVALGAAATVLLATRVGMPVSTTHALTGALVGAGFLAVGRHMDLRVLGAKFVLPLLFSPVLSLLLARALYPAASALRRGFGVERTSCVCVGVAPTEVYAADLAPVASRLPRVLVTTNTSAVCAERYEGAVLGVSMQTLVDGAHFLSAGAMSFARGLNDAPKIVGVLIVSRALSATPALGAISVAMAVGGVLGARRVAETVSHGISPLAPGQGLVANLVTTGLVALATPLGLPVSTTHVSTGSIVGIGLAAGTARWRTIAAIGLAWVTTLPVAAILAATAYAALRQR